MNSELAKILLNIKAHIRKTRDYLNHDFPEYYSNSKVLEPKEWDWVIRSYRYIKNEKPNIPEELFVRCTQLYVDVFENDANKFLDLSRELMRIQKEGNSEKEIVQSIWSQYDVWRTNFSHMSNEIILFIDETLNDNTNKLNNISKNINVESRELIALKQKIGKGKLREVIDFLLNENKLDNKIQNQLYSIAYKLNTLNEEERMNLIDFRNAGLEKSKIANSLLVLIDELKN